MERISITLEFCFWSNFGHFSILVIFEFQFWSNFGYFSISVLAEFRSKCEKMWLTLYTIEYFLAVYCSWMTQRLKTDWSLPLKSERRTNGFLFFPDALLGYQHRRRDFSSASLVRRPLFLQFLHCYVLFFIPPLVTNGEGGILLFPSPMFFSAAQHSVWKSLEKS